MATSIIRSPNIANKIKLQFRRRSVKALREDEEYDTDAQPMTWTDVVGHVGYVPEEVSTVEQQPMASARSLDTPTGREAQVDVRSSVMQGLDWLKPMLSRRVYISMTPTHGKRG